MPCYHPIKGYQSPFPNENGNFEIVFGDTRLENAGHGDRHMLLPCGKCIGCRLERSRQWALRCMYEMRLHDASCFITLTYNDENIPYSNSLSKRDWQLFLKKLRKKISPLKIRFLMCGEYGIDSDPFSPNELGRPHFHAIIFGYQFPDLEVIGKNHHDQYLYTSAMLEKIWGKGMVSIGEANFETAAYVARYVTKKINGPMAKDHYQHYKPTGEVFDLEPEFMLSSRNPGIARDFYLKYRSDFDRGYVTKEGIKQATPKYFEKIFKEVDPEKFEEAMTTKRENILHWTDEELSKRRLEVKEKIHQLRANQLKRDSQ